MKRWFLAQPIHRKMVLTSMAKTTVVLGLAMAVLLALDVVRYQRNATAAAAAFGSIAAESIRAALLLEDAPAVTATLNTLRLQPTLQLACAYRTDGTLVSEFTRESSIRCPQQPPAVIPWNRLAAVIPVQQNNAVVGSVLVQISWSTMLTRLTTAGLASFILLILAAGVTLYLSNRLYRNITSPIAQLAAAARRFGQEGEPPRPIETNATDEVGQLVKAFNAMAARVRTANRHLNEVNDSLRREVDERRAIEIEREGLLVREQEANRTKDEFLAVVSHELRTPLNAIVGWSRILVSTDPDRETIAKAAASLHRNALAQARVIDDLIDISRIVTGKLTVVSEPVDLRVVVEAAVDATRSVAQHAGLTVTMRLPSIPCIVMGDRHRLRQVISNLLSNAVKFAPRSIVTIQLQPEDASLRLSVSDTGIGIPPEFIDHVFDRFRQADASHTRDHGGLGLGLTIAKQLVELHGGSIRAESGGRGLGATFTVTLPWASQMTLSERTDDAVPLLTDVSVLAVDDNRDALELLEAALSQAGAAVRVASSGAEAIELWQAAPSDVLLCDLAMPRMSGYEVLACIRELDRAEGRLTPAIALTAHATEEQVARTAQAGFQVHVAKPFDVARLIRAISLARGRV